jgi:hypothetical protein
VTDANRLGAAVGKIQFTDQAVALAARWLPTLLADSERIHGIAPGSTERPRDYDSPAELAKFPEQQIPLILAITAGLTGPPHRYGDGMYAGHWGLTYTALVHGPTERDTKMQESVYGVALRMLGVRQLADLGRIDTGPDPRTLDLFGVTGPLLTTPLFTILGATYEDEGYALESLSRRKTLLGPSVEFTVQVRDHVTDGQALAAPDPDPLGDPGPYPAAETVALTLNDKPFQTPED